MTSRKNPNSLVSLRWALLLCALAMFLIAGCSSSVPTKKIASDLAKGDQVTLRLALGSGGQMEVTGVDVKVDNDAEENDDGEQGEVEDGTENDGVECEQEGEHEGDNEGCTPLQAVVGPTVLKEAGVAQVMWLKVQVPAGVSLADKNVRRFSGGYQGTGTFTAAKVTTTAKTTPRVIGTLQDIVQLSGGKLGLRIFDKTLPVNAKLRLNNVPSLSQTIEQDKDGDTENDGVVCEQQGEHEGDNQGC